MFICSCMSEHGRSCVRNFQTILIGCTSLPTVLSIFGLTKLELICRISWRSSRYLQLVSSTPRYASVEWPKTLVAEHGFNVVHQLTPVSPRQPSMIFGLSAPVIIGPMNGGIDYPPHNDLTGGFERTILSVLRSTSMFWNAIVPGKRRAALLLVANKSTYEALPSNIKSNKILELVENGVDPDCFRVAASTTREGNFRIIYVGRLVDYKRVDLLLEACGKLIGKMNFHLHIVGDGRLRSALEEQVSQLSLTDHVQFHGWIPQTQVAELLRSSDLFAFPSMRECGGAAVLEAMASGIPVIATKWGGPASYLTEDTGILIPPSRPEEFITEFATAILMMARNPDARAKIGEAARHRALTLYDWHVKTDSLLSFYEDLVSTNTSKRTIDGGLGDYRDPGGLVF